MEGLEWEILGRPETIPHFLLSGTLTHRIYTRREILDAALNHVSRYGWSQECIATGAKDLGLSPMTHGMFARGGIELVEHLQDKNHEEWLVDLKATNTEVTVCVLVCVREGMW